MTPILVLLLLFTFIVELLFYQYALSIRWKKGLKTFSRNKNFIMNLDCSAKTRVEKVNCRVAAPSRVTMLMLKGDKVYVPVPARVPIYGAAHHCAEKTRK